MLWAGKFWPGTAPGLRCPRPSPDSTRVLETATPVRTSQAGGASPGSSGLPVGGPGASPAPSDSAPHPQTGAWGCFDEFNRINVEVLSVVAQQILSILSALAASLTRFYFEGFEINLVWSCGIFITMNPGTGRGGGRGVQGR